MPRRLLHVRAHGKTMPSARCLDRELIALDYNGPLVHWGRARFNKHAALLRMRQLGVPTPEVYSASEANSLLDEQGGLPEWPNCAQVIGRKDHHRAGSGFWFCRSKFQVNAAAEAGATHFLRYIPNAREFRVHIAHGKSIKLTEKLHVGGAIGGDVNRDAPGEPYIRSHANGWHQLAPQPGAHRASLRKHAKAAVQALGLELGAVDILMKEGRSRAQFWVLEVNAAPALTDQRSDTLHRYADAIKQHHDCQNC